LNKLVPAIRQSSLRCSRIYKERLVHIRIFVILFALTATAVLQAQHFSFELFGQAQGLSSLNVVCLLQDNAGFLWVGTVNGLFRFDGHQFVRFGRNEGLSELEIHAIRQTSDGVIWAAGEAGLFWFDGIAFKQAAAPVAIHIRMAETLFADSQTRLFVGTPQGLLVGTSGGGNSNPRSFRFVPLVPQGKGIGAIHVDRRGVLWFSRSGALYSLQDQRLTAYGSKEGVPDALWSSIQIDKSGTLWIRGSDQFREYVSSLHQMIRNLPRETKSYRRRIPTIT
jgi:ligand-binding sensor domain-containing protein